MITGKFYGVLSTVASTATMGATVARQAAYENTPVPPTMIPFIGAVPVFAVAVGILTALLVRVVVMTSSPGKLWSYNIAVTGLAMLGTATFIIDHQTGPGMSFWVGSAFGAVGVGLIQVAKSKIFTTIIDGIKDGLSKGLDDTNP